MRDDTRGKVVQLLGRRASVTPNEAAAALRISERSARRHLHQLFLHHEATREGEYVGNPPVFSYRYHAKPAKTGA